LNKLFDFLKRILVESMGGIATSSMIVCVVSGIFLVIPYKIVSPLDSISLMLLDSPAASYIRNIHFWSAQFLLVFTILHIIDHFIQKTEYNLSRGIWLRLTLSLPVLLFVMISGFILKGDADSFSAFRILSSLFERIPVIGDLLRGSLLGNETSLELVYVHHIATATIILFIILYEHSRKIWPTATGFTMLLFIFLLLSYFLHAPLGQETGKGPWYFIGFQEILHWSSRPGWTWLLLQSILALIWVLPRIGFNLNLKVKNLLLLILSVYILETITGVFFRGENWRWKWPWTDTAHAGNAVSFHPLTLKLAEDFSYQEAVPVIRGQREGCLVCHDKTAGIEKAHDPAAVGCLSCHGGNPFTLDKSLAHRGLVLIPGNLADAQKSCGSASCHPDIPRRVSNSIMSTMSGVVTVDRFVFGENHSLSAFSHIKDIGHAAADQHLRDLCANCHLGNPKMEPGRVTQLSRGGGCNGCHLNYSDSALFSLTQAEARLKSGIFYHPQLSLAVSDEHCFGCHSRSGRIATSYEGWHETLLEKENIPADGRYREMEDQRVFEYIKDDVHHQAGMTCIDCHASFELMGDGNLYAHKEEQVKIMCEDCHIQDRPATIKYQDFDTESKKIIAQRKWQVEDLDFIICQSAGKPMVNTWIDESGRAVLRTKSRDSLLVMKPPLPVCTAGTVHKSLSCESCHTSWVPQCIGCHNSYDPEMKGFDMLENREKTGNWVEHVGRFMADKPTLGVVVDSLGMKQVKTFTPGMVLSIDTASFRNKNNDKADFFHRLYAPISAHTTMREGRNCISCHLDPLAIGYGRGELVYDVSPGKGKWYFRNRFAFNDHDNLPEDAWIGFLSERSGTSATRDNARPFNLEEQKSILMVGACLTCHDENSPVMRESLSDFPSLLKKVSKKCVLPEW
jgi:hypothetical protein